jgi:hypothetical protein
MQSWRYFVIKSVLFPFIGQPLSASVVTGQTMDSRLDQNQSVLCIFVLPTLLQMPSNVYRLFDQTVDVFRNFRSASYIRGN